jgi:hypothetical protein
MTKRFHTSSSAGMTKRFRTSSSAGMTGKNGEMSVAKIALDKLSGANITES